MLFVTLYETTGPRTQIRRLKEMQNNYIRRNGIICRCFASVCGCFVRL